MQCFFQFNSKKKNFYKLRCVYNLAFQYKIMIFEKIIPMQYYEYFFEPLNQPQQFALHQAQYLPLQ